MGKGGREMKGGLERREEKRSGKMGDGKGRAVKKEQKGRRERRGKRGQRREGKKGREREKGFGKGRKRGEG